MSKTVEQQIEKSRNLLKGLNKHLHETGDKSISGNELKSTEDSLKGLEELSNKIELLRNQLNPMVKEMNLKLAELKRVYGEQKKIIKENYPMERWSDYGVPDKR